MLVSAGSALLTGAHRSKYSQYSAGNRRQVQHAAPTTSDTPHVERAAPMASDTLQPKPLTAPVADTPDVNPSSAIMRPFQVARDGSDEVLDEAQYDPDPPSIPRTTLAMNQSQRKDVPSNTTQTKVLLQPNLSLALSLICLPTYPTSPSSTRTQTRIADSFSHKPHHLGLQATSSAG